MKNHKHQSKGQSKHPNCLFTIVTVCAIILALTSWLDILHPVVARQRQLKYSKEVYLFTLKGQTSFYSKINSTMWNDHWWIAIWMVFKSATHSLWCLGLSLSVIQKMRAEIMKKTVLSPCIRIRMHYSSSLECDNRFNLSMSNSPEA